MEVVNKLYPNEDQIKGFLEPGPEGPIYMVKELWDVVALAVWPSRQVMLEVMQSKEMQVLA